MANACSWQATLAFIACVLLLFQIFYAPSAQPTVDPEVLAKYEQMLAKAQDVLSKQQTMAFNIEAQGGANLPPHQILAAPPQEKQPQTLRSASASRSTDICIGMAQGISSENLVTFVASFRQFSTARLVLFMDTPISPRNIEITRQYSVEVIEFKPADLQPAAMQHYHPSSYRWPLIYRYFQLSKDKFTRVLMIDVRDSAFQSNPFDIITAPGFYTFNGVESKTIGACGWNSRWVKDCFGQQMLNKVYSSNIICSGVSLGTYDEVMDYLRQMNDIITGVTTSAQFPQCESNGVDQGAHNVLVHTGKIKNLRLGTQTEGMVMNMQAGKGKVNNGVVYNPLGRKVAIVHQYDRNQALTQQYYRTFKYWEQPATTAVAQTVDGCRGYTLASGYDGFLGKCDLKGLIALDPTQCCNICDQTPGCKGFTLLNSMCWLKNCGDVLNPAPQKSGAVFGYKK